MLLYHRFMRKQTVALPLIALNLASKVKKTTVCLINNVNVTSYYNSSLLYFMAIYMGEVPGCQCLKNCI